MHRALSNQHKAKNIKEV